MFTFQFRCRKLHCPYGQKPYNGQCKTVFLATTGVSVYFLFQLDIRWDEARICSEGFQDVQDTEKLLLSVNNEVYGKLWLEKCRPCYYDVCVFKKRVMSSKETKHHSRSVLQPPVHSLPTMKREPVTSNESWYVPDNTEMLQGVLYSVQIITREDCSFDFIFEKAAALIDKGISVSYNNKTIFLSVSLRDINTTEAIRWHQSDCIGKTINSGIQNDYTCINPDVIITEVPCPLYHLEYSELTSLQDNDKETFMKHFFDTKPLNESAVTKVCVDRYNRIMANKNGSRRILKHSVHALCIIFLYQLKTIP